jgi:transposase
LSARKSSRSRALRRDCVQVVIALIVTPDGFPLAYEVLSGNTSDKTTLPDILRRIEAQYGKAQRIWVMTSDSADIAKTCAAVRANSA